MLAHWIESGLHARQGKAVTNFKKTLPAPQSDLAAELVRDPYNFYLSAVDDRLRHPDDKPSIGLILCKTRSKVVAEYALRDVAKPIGVARYVTKLMESLPAGFQGQLPTIADLERELTKGKAGDWKEFK